MIITYFGGQFVKISQGDTVIAINPPSKDSKRGKNASRFGSILALSTTNHPDYNGFETATYGENAPFQVSGPGEYECQGIAVIGKGTTTTLDGTEYNTAVYKFNFEEINIGFLGPIDKPLLAAELEVLSDTDILFISLGKLTPAQAYKQAVTIGAKIIIPMEYTPETLKQFLKEAAEEKVEPLDKLTIRRKEIESKDGDVIVLAEN